MKSLLLVISTMLISSLVIAQNFAYDTTRHFSINEEAGGTYSMSVHFTTIDSSDITFKWKALENTLPAQWSMSLCDYPNCFFTIPDSATMWPITSSQFAMGTRGFFTLLVDTDDSTRTGSLSLYVYDSTDFSIGDTIRWDVSTYAVEDTADTTTNTSNIKAITEVEIFPNPTRQFIRITGLNLERIDIYDLLGAQVMSISGLKSDQTSINLADLPPGIYSVQVKSREGIFVQKVVKR